MERWLILLLVIAKIFFTHATDNSLIIVGGITELDLNDPYSSETVTNNTEFLGCSTNIDLPPYPEPIFGALLLHWQES